MIQIAPIYLEPLIRLTCFLFLLGALGMWQYRWPYQTLLMPLKQRWTTHGLLFVISLTLSWGLFFSILPLEMAAQVIDHKIGLLQLPALTGLPFIGQVIIGILWLDLSMYIAHRFCHRWSLAWRFHKVHHTDRDIELSTGLRFHPLESLITFGIKIVAIIFVGPPVLAVLIFEILLTSALLFSHSNVSLSQTTDRVLRKVLVTPAMHGIHHSDLPNDYGCNFGLIFSIWDKLFSTYRPYSQLGPGYLNKGLVGYHDRHEQSLKGLLWGPFKRRKKFVAASKAHMSSPL